MEGTPIASRLHVGIFGNTNAGKSTLFNRILGQDIAIVSNQKGTTTDPVIKTMELNPYGPIVLIDTGGLDDVSEIGQSRIMKTRNIIGRIDLGIYATDANDFDEEAYLEMVIKFEQNKIPHILVFTKTDTITDIKKEALKKLYKDCFFTSSEDLQMIQVLKQKIGDELKKIKSKDKTIIGDVLSPGAMVVMVIPIDSGAPKGRMILPQVQFIRDCLDHNIRCLVTREEGLRDTLLEQKKVDLVVVDSQIFETVNEEVPREIPLTSFSILLANQKGDIRAFVKGTKVINKLPENAKILMAEGCSHSHTHEDIGRVKIPNILRKYTGKNLQFDFYSGYDFPGNLSEYDLIIHCGGCMLNDKAILTRLDICEEIGVPVTNYGVVLAYLTGILPRCMEIFSLDKEEKK